MVKTAKVLQSQNAVSGRNEQNNRGAK